MGLLDLTTDLKSLKFGRDRRGGGSSQQPFIQTPIPGTFDDLESNSTDFLLRDGALSRGVDDVERLGRFLVTVDGLLFIAKQTALSLQNPIVPGKPNRRDPGGLTGLYNPLATEEQVALNAIGGHIERQSFLPVYDPEDKYFAKIKRDYNDTNTNRLSILYNTKIVDVENSTPPQELAATAQAINLLDPLTLITYDVGSDSEFKTNIRIQNPTVRATNLPEGEPFDTYQVGWDPWVSRGGFQLGSEGVNFVGASQKYQELNEINYGFGQVFTPSELNALTGINLDAQPNTPFGLTIGDNSTLTLNDRGLDLTTSEGYQIGTYRKFYDNGFDGWHFQSNGLRIVGASLNYVFDGVNGEEPLGLDALGTLTGINEEGQQARYFGPQDDNKTFSTDTKDLDLKAYQTGAGAFYSRGGLDLGVVGENVIGASRAFKNQEEVNGEAPPLDLGDITGITSNGDQLNPYGPQDDNTTLSTNLKSLDLASYQNGLDSPRARINDDPNAAEKYYAISNPIASYRAYGLRPGDSDPVTLAQAKSSRDANLEGQQMVKFFIELLNNNSNGSSEYLYFRAYIDGITDSFSGEWSDVKYTGRAEKFYQYKGFNRDIGIDFTMYAHTQPELSAIYRKLNTLIGAVTPDYSDSGYMRGTIVKLTVGDYFKSLPAVITSIGTGGHLDAGWDINEGSQSSRLLKISLKMNPIHDFLPKKGANFYSVA